MKLPDGCMLVDEANYSRHMAELTILRHKMDGEVWFWMGDGSDVPETLACPVIMDADTLRKLLASQNTPPSQPLEPNYAGLITDS